MAGSPNYMIVPLAAFAEKSPDNQTCGLAITPLQTGSQNADSIILGSMFFSLYEAYFEYDYTNGNQSMSLALSANNTLKGSYIGNAAYTQSKSPF